MKLKKLIGASLIALAMGTGCVATMPDGSVIVAGPPPPPRVEIVAPPPYSGAVWINGHWGWRGGRYAWVGGRYTRARTGHQWVPARCWQGPGGRWHCGRGYWRGI